MNHRHHTPFNASLDSCFFRPRVKMSKIAKVAVTDARLMQDEPAYAVQKGALSVSVAPFQAISASASQMTFQVLVPSLNVFIDRKISISTPLSFNTTLFWGGARGPSYRTTYVAVSEAATFAQGVSIINTATLYTAGADMTATGSPLAGTLVTAKAAWEAQIAAGQPPVLVGSMFQPNTVLTAVGTPAGAVVALTFSPPLATAVTNSQPFLILASTLFDVPDAQMGSHATAAATGVDMGLVAAQGGLPGALSGYATAVSGKDLSWIQFPIQSALVNMTATLNDCTVTTNGDTLREQLMLTSSQETLKQRTTPTNADVYSWGRDDAQNGSGNFSTYSVVNQYGDVPNGAWPVAWSSNPSCSAQLTVPTLTTAAVGAGAAASWPFLEVTKAHSFFPSTYANGAAYGGTGFYIAATNAPSVTLPTAAYGSTNVLVPFYNYQPVWTTGFPGGDLLGTLTGAQNIDACLGTNQFIILNSYLNLRLNVNVPPLSMIGARVYDATAGNYGTTAAPALPAAANASTNGCMGIVTSIISGQIGQAGSVYGITWSSTGYNATTITLATTAPTGGIFALSGGCPVGYGLPVYGTISCSESLVISPLIWADAAEFSSVGLYGMTNMQFVLNFATLGTTAAVINPNVALVGNTTKALSSQPYWIDNLSINNPNTGNILRSSNIRSVLSDLRFASTSSNQGPWGGGPSSIATTSASAPTLFATFLTPGVDVTLPEVSTVPYVEFPRYFYQTGQAFKGLTAPVIVSQTISLTSIPDMVMVYVKPDTRGPSQLEQYIPISKVSVTFDNFSNLCSSFQQIHLYECAVAAGLDMDWHQWRGFTQAQIASGVLPDTAAAASTPASYNKQSPFTQLSGGPILLRMGQDITLQPGLAPGCLGNYSFQITVTMDNTKGYYDYVKNPVITIIAINTGFFETMRGQSAIRKTILQMADVAAATTDSGMSKTQLNRMVGRGNYFKGASNLVQRGLSAVKAAKGINDRYHITDLARTYGGQTGSRLADAADTAMSMGAQANDSLYGGAKRHRPSGL